MRLPRSWSELRRYGPNPAEAALRIQAEEVGGALAEQRDRWRRGFTRRKVLAGAGKVGVAALGTQLVTTRVAFAAPGETGNRTLVAVFLRGGMDGLSALVPAGDPNLLRARPNIVIPASALLDAGPGWGLHPAFTSLKPFWDAGKMVAVPGVYAPFQNRSHFECEAALERGGPEGALHDGWLDRTLVALGAGTTFRAVAVGERMPLSLVGPADKIVMGSLQEFGITNTGGMRDRTVKALESLYTGFDHPLATQAKLTIKALEAVQKMNSRGRSTTAAYPAGRFANGLRDLATLIKAGAGLRAAAIDVGGWDTHTGQGRVDGGQMRDHLTDLSDSLAAFCTDLGPALDDVTVTVQTEFGRTLEENGNGGTDHGYGGVMFVLGGGLNGGRVHGRWPGLSSGVLAGGDVPGANDYRDVLGEVLAARLGIGDVGRIFPDHKYQRIGLFR